MNQNDPNARPIDRGDNNRADNNRDGNDQASLSRREPPGFNEPLADDEPLPVAETPGGMAKKITAFGKDRRHEDDWSRTPNANGTGAIHVKTFHSKLTADALEYMDRSINEWLDAHPQYEVKLITSTIGTFTGKTKEPQLICQVWV